MSTRTIAFRRDKLLRLARAGRLVSVSSYSFDDWMGSHRTYVELPVRVIQTGGDFRDGYMNVLACSFSAGSGSCRQDERGLITLYVHSNSHYVFRLLAEGEPAPEPISQDDPRRQGKEGR